MSIKKFYIRLLEKNDFHKGYLQLLSELTGIGTVSEKDFIERFEEIVKSGNTHICVIECDDLIVASGTIIIEKKFIHSCSQIGHIEDIVVSEKYRKHRLGKQIIDKLLDIAKENGCYKTVLYCNDQTKPFYKKCGFTEYENLMIKRYQQ